MHISDTHVRPGADTGDGLRRTLAEIASLAPPPAFIIDTGDNTEMGSPEELQLYRNIIASSTIPVYPVPGNHDARWSGVGKEAYERIVAAPYRSFDHGGVHFALLDSSLLLEQYGHFDPDQLAWLSRDLAAVPPDRPIIAAMHHPVAIDRTFIDNEWDLLEILARHNTVLVLAGHVHTVRHWRLNGTDLVTSGAVMGKDSAYGLIDISAGEVRWALRRVGREGVEQEMRRTVGNAERLLLDRILNPALVAIGPERIILGELALPGASLSEVSVQINHAPPRPATKEGQSWVLSLGPDAFPAGLSTVLLRAQTSKGETLARSVQYRSPEYEAVVRAQVPTGGGIQSWPSVVEGRVYFGSNDGMIRCREEGTLGSVWDFETGAEVLSMPVVDGGRLYAGSCDGVMYALDAATGRERWRFEAGEAIYSTVALDDERVYFGCGDSHLYALDRNTGQFRWKFRCESFTKNRPVLAGGRLYFGNWDRRVRCVDPKTGDLIWEQTVARNPLFPCATSNPLPFGELLIIATHDYNVRALALSDGSEVWVHQQTDTAKPSYSSPALYDGTAIFGSITGHVLGLDAATGKERFNTPVNTFEDPLFDSSPCRVGDRFYCGSVGGFIYEAKATNGEITQRFRLSPAYVFSTPASDGNYVYVGSMDGSLYTLDFPESEE